MPSKCDIQCHVAHWSDPLSRLQILAVVRPVEMTLSLLRPVIVTQRKDRNVKSRVQLNDRRLINFSAACPVANRQLIGYCEIYFVCMVLKQTLAML